MSRKTKSMSGTRTRTRRWQDGQENDARRIERLLGRVRSLDHSPGRWDTAPYQFMKLEPRYLVCYESEGRDRSGCLHLRRFGETRLQNDG